jgi:simple sugar transport system ATP-binding protein
MPEQLKHLDSTDHVPVDEPIVGVAPRGTPLLELRGICKRYGSFAALDNVNFFIDKSEVIGLLGDNGAGKSTLVRMISGINRQTSGEIFVDGKAATLNSRAESEAAGIETIYQDIALVDSMSITRNIFMGRELTNRFGFMDHKRMEEEAIEILGGAVQISGIDNPRKEVGFLSGGQKRRYSARRLFQAQHPTARRTDLCALGT